jgi:Protein kinase domain
MRAKARSCAVSSPYATTTSAKLVPAHTLSAPPLCSRVDANAVCPRCHTRTRHRSHPFVCSLYTAFQDGAHVYMVLEYAACGDLAAVATRHLRRCLTEAEVRFYAAELVAALEWVHLHGIVSQARPVQTIWVPSLM